jgi:hypothetical protein
MDDAKHGPNTLMAPFNTWDPEVQNGDSLGGCAWPQLLPVKSKMELARRYEGQIKPDRKRMKEWVKRKAAIEKLSLPPA